MVRWSLLGDKRLPEGDFTRGLTGSDKFWPFLPISSLFLDESSTRGDGWRGLGIRWSPNDVVVDNRLGEDSFPLKLKNGKWHETRVTLKLMEEI